MGECLPFAGRASPVIVVPRVRMAPAVDTAGYWPRSRRCSVGRQRSDSLKWRRGRRLRLARRSRLACLHPNGAHSQPAKALADRTLQAAGVRGADTQRRLQRTSGALNKQRAQIDVATPTDVPGRVLPLELRWHGAWRGHAPNCQPFLKTFDCGSVAAQRLYLFVAEPRTRG
jgi:hypothetical protein